MTVSQRIFKILEERKMTQKEFSEKTGIPQSTISDWRKKNTNPASDKILIICSVLDVTPYALLSGVKEEGTRSNGVSCYVVAEGSEEEMIIDKFGELDLEKRSRLLGYLEALGEEQ